MVRTRSRTAGHSSWSGCGDDGEVGATAAYGPSLVTAVGVATGGGTGTTTACWAITAVPHGAARSYRAVVTFAGAPRATVHEVWRRSWSWRDGGTGSSTGSTATTTIFAGTVRVQRVRSRWAPEDPYQSSSQQRSLWHTSSI